MVDVQCKSIDTGNQYGCRDLSRAVTSYRRGLYMSVNQYTSPSIMYFFEATSTGMDDYRQHVRATATETAFMFLYGHYPSFSHARRSRNGRDYDDVDDDNSVCWWWQFCGCGLLLGVACPGRDLVWCVYSAFLDELEFKSLEFFWSNNATYPYPSVSFLHFVVYIILRIMYYVNRMSTIL